MPKTGLLDFTAIRDATDFATVLDHYGLLPDKHGTQIKVNCPFHEDRTPSCSISLEKRAFNCFGCSAQGNVLDFIEQMDDLKSTFEAAKRALEIMGLNSADFRKAGSTTTGAKTPRRGQGNQKTGRKSASTKKAAQEPPQDAGDASKNIDDLEPNPVLHLNLDVVHDHPFLAARHVPPDVAEAFGIGFCDRGIMRGRIAIPIHNQDGELVAYAGRYAEDEVPDDVIRYKIPKTFQKSLELFNLHRAVEFGKRYVVVVEGYWSAIRLHQAGVPVVALMGTAVSKAQADLLRTSGFRFATLILDGDDGGRKAEAAAAHVLSQSVYVHTLTLADGVKPDTMDEEIVDRLRR